MLGPSRRNAIVAAVSIFLFISLWLGRDQLENTSIGTSIGNKINTFQGVTSKRPAEVDLFLEQVFSVDKPRKHEYPALKYMCDNTVWRPELKDVYIHCVYMFAGMTSIVSQIKVCLKMATETGSNILLPSMPLRDSKVLQEFNLNNADKYLPYDQWFDADHLTEVMGRVCPQIKILRPDQVGPGKIAIKNKWDIDIGKAPGYHQFTSHFWTGRPFKEFFDDQFDELVAKAPKDSLAPPGITQIDIASLFLLFKITDDPTHRDLKLWNEFSLLIRYLKGVRTVAIKLLDEIPRPFYGVHFRVENDTIWSSLETQLSRDLDALDQAWEQFRDDVVVSSGPPKKPPVYLACGDEAAMKKFIEEGEKRGWEVTHKWDLARKHSDQTVVAQIDALAFDFQGAVDQGVMLEASFFLGISGSAFSSTTANARDVTGRYRGSSFTNVVDENARNHLFNDGDASSYACCL
ncbi:hypothetical protein BJ878DRAFT_494010 [Calycina marina]|uniref:O-fucosyltransferase family protein n=1 Tax=Calycina marina TaxID=1763456 RepID=A0A9P7Z887_9HELO|nr:hypothetical protein BJ878DRAFT_494010 [Calycina marina]